jgi:hypothetical protein
MPADQAHGPGRRVFLAWEQNESPNAVRPSEGNEVRPEGQQGIGALHSTDEAGEPTHGTPGREGGAGSWN